ncbi:MAG: hypothetical protein V1866_04215 [archaeon]
MDWIEDIPTIFLTIVAVIAGIGAIIFINSVDFGNPNKSDENLDRTTGYIVDNVVPTEINWISWLAGKLSGHPFILMGAILTILWLFGYFLPKGPK